MLGIFFLAGASVAAAPPISSDAELPHARVVYSDLNLASPEGRERLDRRVRAAADAICGEAFIRDLEQRRAETICRKAVMSSAKPQVQTAVAQARTGVGVVAAAASAIGSK